MDTGDRRGQIVNGGIKTEEVTAGGEGLLQNEPNAGLRFIQEGRADHSDTFRTFVEEYGQIIHDIGLPTRYWKRLHEKLENELFDAGNSFMLTQNDDDTSQFTLKLVVSAEEGLSFDDPNQIYLIDHCCTWRSEDELSYLLEAMEGLDMRLAAILGIGGETDDRHTEIKKRIWSLNDVYSFRTNGHDIDVFYLNDEVGSRIYHSDQPTFKMRLLTYMPLGGTLTLIWPNKDVSYGEQVTSDKFYYENDESKKLMLSRSVRNNLGDDVVTSIITSEKTQLWFDEWKRIMNEDIPITSSHTRTFSNPVRVYTDIRSLLEAPLENYVMVDNADDADIIWTAEHCKDFTQCCNKMLSQFPNEWVLTTKIGLMETAKRCREQDQQHPVWFADTYDLNSEIVNFIAAFAQRKQQAVDNHWIIKAWNLAHGTSTKVVNNMSEIVTMRRTSTPFTISKYVERPFLITSCHGRVKFDFRYHIVVRSFAPLQAYAMKRFWPKLAVKSYDLEKITDTGRHLTNIAISEERNQPDYDEFIAQFENEATLLGPHGLNWAEHVEKPTLAAIRTVLEKAAEDSNKGVVQLENCRTLYGVDVMLQHNPNDSVQPVILEFNFGPDCSRVASINTAFYQEILDLAYTSPDPSSLEYAVKL